MKSGARSVLEDWNGDLAIVGLVKRPGEVVSLWLVPRQGEGTLDRGDQPYKLEDVTLGEDFHDDIRAQLTAVALAAVAPLADNEVLGQVLDTGLLAAANQLSELIHSEAVRKPEHLAALHDAHGTALVALGQRESGPDRLEQAVEAHRAALREIRRGRGAAQLGDGSKQPRKRALDAGGAGSWHRPDKASGGRLSCSA